MKKILYICAEATAGMVPYAVNVIRCASRSSRLDVYAVTVDDYNFSYRSYFDERLAGKISFLKISSGGWKRKADKIYPLKILREAKRICEARRIEVIHLLTVDYTCWMIVPELKKTAEVYYTVHDVVPHERYFRNLRERLADAYIRWGVKRNMKQAGNLVTNGRAQYATLKRACPGKRVWYHVFPSLITESIMNGNDVCPELRGVGKYILFFGSIDEYKGVKYLYDAFVGNDRLSGYTLVIAGKGTVCFPCSGGDPGVVRINRYVEESEVKALFRQAACVVYPYLSATQSGALTLAYCFRTPALVSDIPFFRETSDEGCCLYFRTADSADLSDKLETLLFAADLSAMKAAQKAHYDACYSEKAAVASIETIYPDSL
jgi:glycosyltransferase involved in cell wall biosynthesis